MIELGSPKLMDITQKQNKKYCNLPMQILN